MEAILGLAGLWLFFQFAVPVLLFGLVAYGLYRYFRRDTVNAVPDRHEFASTEPTPHPEVPYRPDLGWHPENDMGNHLLDSQGRPIHRIDETGRPQG
jgi:hypothetical protein